MPAKLEMLTAQRQRGGGFTDFVKVFNKMQKLEG